MKGVVIINPKPLEQIKEEKLGPLNEELSPIYEALLDLDTRYNNLEAKYDKVCEELRAIKGGTV